MKDCSSCKKEKLDYGNWNPIFIGYDNGDMRRIEDVMYCDLHGIMRTDKE